MNFSRDLKYRLVYVSSLLHGDATLSNHVISFIFTKLLRNKAIIIYYWKNWRNHIFVLFSVNYIYWLDHCWKIIDSNSFFFFYLNIFHFSTWVKHSRIFVTARWAYLDWMQFRIVHFNFTHSRLPRTLYILFSFFFSFLCYLKFSGKNFITGAHDATR